MGVLHYIGIYLLISIPLSLVVARVCGFNDREAMGADRTTSPTSQVIL